MSDPTIQPRRRFGTFAGVFPACVPMLVAVIFGVDAPDSAGDVRLGD